MRKNKKMDENTKVYYLQVSTDIYRLMENFLWMLINKGFKLDFFLHFISKKGLNLKENRGNDDLRKTII